MDILEKHFKKILPGFVFGPIVIWCIYTVNVYGDLEYVGERYYKNQESVYYRHTLGGFSVSPQLVKIRDADADSFECILTPHGIEDRFMSCRHEARDKNHTYSHGRVIDIEAEL
jgi:hypothetical protein